MSKKHKKHHRDEEDPSEARVGRVNLSIVSDRQTGDKRFERERLIRETEGVGTSSTSSQSQTAAMSSTFDAFRRVTAGLEARTIADRIGDPNRPTWEEYKKVNEDKLDMVGGEMRKMAEYRAELDRERERRLSRAAAGKKSSSKSQAISSDDEESDSDNSTGSDSHSASDSETRKRKHKEKKKKNKKEKSKSKKHKSSKKHQRDSDDERST